jgi:hypothetical protein
MTRVLLRRTLEVEQFSVQSKKTAADCDFLLTLRSAENTNCPL